MRRVSDEERVSDDGGMDRARTARNKEGGGGGAGGGERLAPCLLSHSPSLSLCCSSREKQLPNRRHQQVRICFVFLHTTSFSLPLSLIFIPISSRESTLTLSLPLPEGSSP